MQLTSPFLVGGSNPGILTPTKPNHCAHPGASTGALTAPSLASSECRLQGTARLGAPKGWGPGEGDDERGREALASPDSLLNLCTPFETCAVAHTTATSPRGCEDLARGAAIGQVWTRHCCSNRACPTAFIALSVHHMFIWPVALFVFQTVLGPCLPGWGQGCGLRVLGFIAWAYYSLDTETGSWHYSLFHIWVLRLPQLCLLALAPLGHTPLALWSPGVMEGSRCERSGVSRFGCCHQPWQGMVVLRAEKPQLELAGTYNIQFGGWVGGVGGWVGPFRGCGLSSQTSACGRTGCHCPRWMPINGRVWGTWSSPYCSGRWTPCPRTLGCRASSRMHGGGGFIATRFKELSRVLDSLSVIGEGGSGDLKVVCAGPRNRGVVSPRACSDAGVRGKRAGSAFVGAFAPVWG